MSTRRRARELVLRALYAMELSQNPVSFVIKDMFKKRAKEDLLYDFCVQLTKTTHSHRDEFDQIIKAKALNWDFDRIAIIDKIILRIAMSEFLCFDDIPPKVTIDEAIEIGKKFSTEKSGKFINGILDAVLADWKTEKKIKKTGRGLIDDKKKKSEPLDPMLSKSGWFELSK